MNNFNFKKINNIKFCIDSRELKRSNTFFCLKGKKTDGHNFVNKNIKIEEVSQKLRGTFAEQSPLDSTLPISQVYGFFLIFNPLLI